MLADYEYLGQDGYCKENSTKRVGKFKARRRECISPGGSDLVFAPLSW